jgi:hypothetical protein
VGHMSVFSSGAIMSWSGGCVRPPSLGVDAHEVDLRG